MTIGYALVQTAIDLNEPGEFDNIEYMRGQANLICDSLGWTSDQMFLPTMAALAHMITIDELFDAFYRRMPLRKLDDICDRMDDEIEKAYVRARST